jgi:molybdopterin converting factor small subunit
MATIRIHLFGQLAAAVQSSQLAVNVEAPTCGALRQQIAAQEPRLASLLPACRFAVNHRFAEDGTMVRESDEVALIGFVSGG